MDESYNSEKSYNNDKSLEIQSLTKYGHDLLTSGSHVEASDTFLNAYQLAKQTNDLFIIRGCCFNLGACYVASGQPKLGLKYLEMAIPNPVEEDGLENYSDLWYNLGVARHAIGDIDRAILAYEKAQSGYKEMNSRKLEAECLSKLAVSYHLRGRLKDSQAAYYKAHEVYELIGDRNNQALCLISLTGVFSELKDIDGCAKILDILLDVCQELEDHFLQAKIYHDIGLLYITEKLYESAAECFEQSLISVSKEIAVPDKHLEATILQNLGAVCNYMTSYHKAIKYHQKAIDIYGELADRINQTQVFGNLAYAYTQINDYENAIMAFKHAVRAAKDSGDKDSQCLSTEGLAGIYFRIEDYEKSVMAYKEALSLISKSGDSTHSDRIVAKLSDAIQFQVESQRLDGDNQHSTEQEERKKRHSNTMRYFKDKQHSLIAKGLEAFSSSEEDDESVENDRSVQVRKARVMREEKLPDAKQHELSVIPEHGMNFSMKSTLGKTVYEKPIDENTEVSRMAKELYLAKVSQDNIKKRGGEVPERKESSKMCTVM